MQNLTTMPRLGEGLKTEKMPGHWVLARLGKRVLRPGMELTRRMLERLAIKPSDEVIEFAPGMGTTARLTLALAPSSYTAVERDKAAAETVSSYLAGPKQRCVIGSASETGLSAESATVVYGEAMLTMQTEEVKLSIVREAYRLLKHAYSVSVIEGRTYASRRAEENERGGEAARQVAGVPGGLNRKPRLVEEQRRHRHALRF